MTDANRGNLTRVLVVDDEEVMRDMMRDILEQSGYIVETASDGDEALAKLGEHLFGLVFTDIRMPRMDGLELLRQIRCLDPSLDVIMMTGYATVDIAVEAMKLGAADFITKPFNLDHILIVANRVSERRRLMKQAEEGEYYRKMSLTDGLTGLYNRRHFEATIETEISRSRRSNRKFCVLMIDVDHFKIYNDTLGHPAGDEALKSIAWLLKHHARQSDTVCRYGGEEFAIILPETSAPDARLTAERLRRVVEQADFERQDVIPKGSLTVSIGVACYPDDATTTEGMVQKADQALYQAKREGRNKVVGSVESKTGRDASGA
ncbi:MAG: hypothetical protein Kow0099_36910 [Candidatus Abyssubacteria bacterium]